MTEMYHRDKPTRSTKHPSFSSTLLDEIYRSIDGSDEKFGEFNIRNQKLSKKETAGASAGVVRGKLKCRSAVEDEEIASFRRACLVEKWMEMKANEKALTGGRRRGPPSLPEFDRKPTLDNDPLFFSSGSSSSDSSFGWYSEAEAAAKPKHSCFGPLNRPKQVKTTKSQTRFDQFDDDQTNKPDLIRAKTRALKIYAGLKKVKSPISPGGRLTTFLNTLFSNGETKKLKDSTLENRTQNPLRSRDQVNDGVKQTVRFFPASVIADRDSRPNGEKRPDFKKVVPAFQSDFKECRTHDFDDEEEDEEDDDVASDSSSDLFELDHLTIFKNRDYCEELPVYETTNLGTNRAIASGLIC